MHIFEYRQSLILFPRVYRTHFCACVRFHELTRLLSFLRVIKPRRHFDLELRSGELTWKIFVIIFAYIRLNNSMDLLRVKVSGGGGTGISECPDGHFLLYYE